MTIGNVEAAPLAAVQGVIEVGGRERSAAPHEAHPEQEPAAPAPAAPVPVRRVTLPEFPHYELSFRLDEERGRVVVQVIDAKTGTVVRSVPPEDLGRTVRRLPDPRGLLLDRES